MGTPEFSVPCLKSLIKEGHKISAVYTQSDKPKGRGNKLAMPPVKEVALENNLPVFQPKTLKIEEEYQRIKEINPDVIVVVAYGKILPKNILDIPKYGCINVHASLLPAYRGAGPIQWCVINGEKKTGITTMQMSEGLDTGDMLLKEEVEILPNETSGELHDRLMNIGADLLIRTLNQLDSITPEKQDDSVSNYAPMLTKALCPINWEDSATKVHNLVRGLNPWPVATAEFNDKSLKIYETEPIERKGRPGEILSLNPFIVACGEGAVIVKSLQREGKKRMASEDFVRGVQIKIGDIFK